MSGNLIIKPLKATLTRDVDFFSKMDPYCVIYLGTQKFTTSIAQGQGKNPTWCNEFAARRTSEDQLRIEVWDYDSGSKNDYIADAAHPLHSLLQSGGTKTEWVNLAYKGKGAGQIMIELTWKPDQGMMPMQQPPMQQPFQQPPMQQPFQQPPMQQPFQQPPMQQPFQQPPMQQPFQQPPMQQPYPMQQQPFQQPPMHQQYPMQQPYGQQGMMPPPFQQPYPQGQMMPPQQFVQPQVIPAFGNPMMMQQCNMIQYPHYKPPVNAHGYKPLSLIQFRHDCHKCHGSGNSKGYPCKKCYHHFGYCKKCCGTHYEIKSGHKCSKC